MTVKDTQIIQKRLYFLKKPIYIEIVLKMISYLINFYLK